MIESIYPEIMNVFNNRTFGEQKMDEWTRNPKPFDVEMHLLPGTPYGMCFRVKLQLERLAIGGDHAAVMKLVPGLYDLYLHDHKMLLFNFYTPSKFKVHLQLNSPDGKWHKIQRLALLEALIHICSRWSGAVQRSLRRRWARRCHFDE